MKRTEFLKHLQTHGCFLVREGSRHSWWGNAANTRRSSVPRHREINDLLVRKICKDLDVVAHGE
ncbi:MAG: type II toxin-antitoxin system HicA family toxin [Candidatus Hydrogenedentes bacterium]|nr:type II toxin-antitoxin system HicA family toxin [Candidatus Hydrogenedentota bacterium]